MTIKLQDGDKIQVSDACLRRQFQNWSVPNVDWHEASVVEGGALVRIIGRGVTVETIALEPGDVRRETARESLVRLQVMLQGFVASGLNDPRARNAVDWYTSALLDVIDNPSDKNVGGLIMALVPFIDVVRYPEYR